MKIVILFTLIFTGVGFVGWLINENVEFLFAMIALGFTSGVIVWAFAEDMMWGKSN